MVTHMEYDWGPVMAGLVVRRQVVSMSQDPTQAVSVNQRTWRLIEARTMSARARTIEAAAELAALRDLGVDQDSGDRAGRALHAADDLLAQVLGLIREG